MPTYGYRCNACDTEFEMVERMIDKPAGRCPACGAPGSRQFYPTGIVFKGTGFYKTDSRSSDGGPAISASPATPGDEAKPAEKSKEGKEGAETKPKAADAKPSKPDGGGTAQGGTGAKTGSAGGESKAG